MSIVIGAGFPIAILLVMYVFGMFTLRNFGWVLLSLLWGAFAYGANYLLNPKLLEMGISWDVVRIIFAPMIRLVLVSLGVLFVVHRQKFDNLVDGAVYGFAAGLGYAIPENIEFLMTSSGSSAEIALMHTFSTSLVLTTASGIMGVAMTQYYFRHRANRLVILLSGLGAAIGYNAVFNLLSTRSVGGEILPIAVAIGGITLMGLYVTGQLRIILIKWALEKKRSNDLLKIVIPIGVELSTEKNFSHLLENILVEAKKFCKADAGILYLVNDRLLEIAVMRNDSLRIAMGGTTGNDVTMPPLNLLDPEGTPYHGNIATHAALSGQTVNIEDGSESKDYDFSVMRAFDRTNGYLSTSFLTIPLKNNEGNVLGVLQLINALNPKREILAFDANLQQLMESFSSLATAALEGYIQEQNLRREIQQLRIEIDAVKRHSQVEEITNTDYFRDLQDKAKTLRADPNIKP